MIKSKYKVKIGITMGDPSGIGPAVTLKSVERLKGVAELVIIGDAWVLSKIRGHKVTSASIIDLANVARKNFVFGKVSAEYGRASLDYLGRALQMLKEKKIDCLVTSPVSKEAVNLSGVRFSGHTEYLAQRSGAKHFAMMLLNRKLKFSLLTRHIPLKDVSAKITSDRIYEDIFLTVKGLKDLFGIKKPRIVVCGLNPHASDNGIIGKEENMVIKPALERIRNKVDCQLDGPFTSDIAVYNAFKGKYDCVIAMYHDQALIPLKLTGIESGVNLTLGLPFIRTSPLHGTAFDIALRPSLADPGSLIEAVKVALRCFLQTKKRPGDVS